MKKKILLILLFIFILSGCEKKEENSGINSVDDLNNEKVGCLTGSYQIEYANENIDNVQIVLLDSITELILNAKDKKVKAFIIDTSYGRFIERTNTNFKSLKQNDTDFEMGFLFSDKSEDLRNNFNKFLEDEKKSGFLDYCYKKWIDNFSYDNKLEEIEPYNASGGEIRIITSATIPPFVFVANGEYSGLFIDIINKFASDYKYELVIDSSTFNGVLSGISTDKYDMGLDNVTITEERKKEFKFSDPIYIDSTSIVFYDDTNKELEYNNYNDLDGKDMGCMSGSIFDLTIQEKMPNSKVSYFNSRAELILGLKQKKIEGYLADKPVGILVCKDNPDLGYIDGVLDNIQYGAVFSKDNLKLKDEFNAFLKDIEKDGFLKKAQNKWFKENAMDEVSDDIELSGKNGNIKVCTTPDAAPFAFFKNNKYQGYEIDLLNEFARRNGYSLTIEGVSFDALISSIVSNKFDIAVNGVYITEERKKSVDFSDPDYISSAVAIVRKNVEIKEGFITSLKNKIYRTFIEEDRYKLIIDGIATTLIITASAILFGTLFGFLAFLLSRKVSVFKKIIDVFSYVVAGLPVVVLLMILFYIIFSKSALSGSIISIIGFTIIVGCSVYEMLKTGVDAIDIGQFEGALALGYTDSQTLFKFILPQALRIIMPSYRGEIISLIKSSSIVGYVTVQDLTRVSDIIRSRTYDAFFPLIVTAIIYFVLAWLLTKIANYLQKKYLSNEKTKDEILKSIGQKK